MTRYDGSNIPPEVVASLPPFLQAEIPLWHENLQPDIYASLAVCHTLACVAVALRLYSRRLKAQPLWWDDWLIFIALVRGYSLLLLYTVVCQTPSHVVSTQVFNFAFLAALAVTTYLGTGRHLVFNVLNQPESIVPSIKMSLVGAVLNCPPLAFTKVRTLCVANALLQYSKTPLDMEACGLLND